MTETAAGGTRTTTHQPDALLSLRTVVAGPVLAPGDEAYEAECAGFNLAQVIRPALAVGATRAEDVAAAVRFATEHGLAVGVRNAAHQVVVPEGDGWLLVTTRRMQDVVVDPAGRTATVGAGVRWSDVLALSAMHGLAPIAGSAPGVGVTGYTLGGGLSPLLGRSHGYAADHVLRMQVVTADARVRDVTVQSEPDLFWALRGCKGNFGIVTRIEFTLFPVSRFYGGGIYFSGEDTPELLRIWRSLVDTLGEETSTSVCLMRIPDLPDSPPMLRGSFVLHLRLAHLGTADEAEEILAPLRAASTALLDTVAERTVGQAGEIHMDPVDPMPVMDRGFGLREFSDATQDKLTELVGPGVDSALQVVEIRALGGALDREPEVPNSVPSRGVPFVVMAGSPITPAAAPALRTALDEFSRELAPWADARTPGNFVSPDDARTEDDVRRLYGAERYERLAEVKRRVDPANTFRVNHNVRPA